MLRHGTGAGSLLTLLPLVELYIGERKFLVLQHLAHFYLHPPENKRMGGRYRMSYIAELLDQLMSGEGPVDRRGLAKLRTMLDAFSRECENCGTFGYQLSFGREHVRCENCGGSGWIDGGVE